MKSKLKINGHFPFWILTIAISIIIIVPKLLQDGMFMDGVLYACVSKNLGNGIGSFWFPKFCKLGFAGHTTFHEHPPLVFWIQAKFFRLLGNSIYTERLYSLFVAIITGVLITKIWTKLFDGNSKLKKFSWLPILVWTIVLLT